MKISDPCNILPKETLQDVYIFAVPEGRTYPTRYKLTLLKDVEKGADHVLICADKSGLYVFNSELINFRDRPVCVSFPDRFHRDCICIGDADNPTVLPIKESAYYIEAGSTVTVNNNFKLSGVKKIIESDNGLTLTVCINPHDRAWLQVLLPYLIDSAPYMWLNLDPSINKLYGLVRIADKDSLIKQVAFGKDIDIQFEMVNL